MTRSEPCSFHPAEVIVVAMVPWEMEPHFVDACSDAYRFSKGEPGEVLLLGGHRLERFGQSYVVASLLLVEYVFTSFLHCSCIFLMCTWLHVTRLVVFGDLAFILRGTPVSSAHVSWT